MLHLSKEQKKHVAKVISAKRRELFGYRGGTRELAHRYHVKRFMLFKHAQQNQHFATAEKKRVSRDSRGCTAINA